MAAKKNSKCKAGRRLDVGPRAVKRHVLFLAGRKRAVAEAMTSDNGRTLPILMLMSNANANAK